MKPVQSASPRELWEGVIVGVAFRTFAYGLLFATSSLLDARGLPVWMSNLLSVLSWTVTATSVFWIPFAAGFLSAYFWGQLKAQEYVGVIWRSAIGFLFVSIALSAALRLPALGFSSFLFVLLDVGMCGKGVDQGALFWKGHLGRQFLGDFSTRDEEDTL